VIHASSIADAFEVIQVVRSNQVVLLNCSQLDTRLGTRLIDICSGGVCAIDGQVHPISAELVLFAPALTRVSCGS
jgi:FtsZ-interacting cell division protein YlmF